MYVLLSVKRSAYFHKSIAIEMGGVSRYFSKVLGSGGDSTLQNKSEATAKELIPKWPKTCPALSLEANMSTNFSWRVAKESSVSWVAKFKGDENSECKLSNGWSRSSEVMKLLLSAMTGRKVTGRQLNVPVFHGTLLRMDFWTPLRFLIFARTFPTPPKNPGYLRSGQDLYS